MSAAELREPSRLPHILPMLLGAHATETVRAAVTVKSLRPARITIESK